MLRWYLCSQLIPICQIIVPLAHCFQQAAGHYLHVCQPSTILDKQRLSSMTHRVLGYENESLTVAKLLVSKSVNDICTVKVHANGDSLDFCSKGSHFESRQTYWISHLKCSVDFLSI